MSGGGGGGGGELADLSKSTSMASSDCKHNRLFYHSRSLFCIHSFIFNFLTLYIVVLVLICQANLLVVNSNGANSENINPTSSSSSSTKNNNTNGNGNKADIGQLLQQIMSITNQSLADAHLRFVDDDEMLYYDEMLCFT